VVHLANIPAPGLSTPAVTFNSNITMNFNVFQAAAALKLPRGVGVQRDHPRPAVRHPAPLRAGRRGPLPGADHHLRAVQGGQRDDRRAHREWSGLPFIALRFSNIMAPEDYQRFAEFRDDPHARKWNLWGYIDQRDVALSCRLALEADAGTVTGNPAFIIAAADTVMNRPSAELLAEVFPGVRLTRDVGEFGTLLAIDRAREVLGFEPAHSWRDHVTV
jgi:Nucleoside-diphosphate-sugar epimerases